MSNLKIQIESIIRNYQGTYISGSGKRTIEKQIYYVKTRPSEYPKTLKKVFEDFNLDKSKMNDKEYLKTVYNGKEEWLKKTILDLARKNVGFQHLSGNAIDVSVRHLSLTSKEQLKKALDEKGYHVIMEWVAGNKSKYNVPISKANVFHIDLLNISNRHTGISNTYVNEKFGPIYRIENMS